MIVVNITRGLGNQMFQYALAYAYQQSGEAVYLYKSYEEEEIREYKDNEIFDVFGISTEIINKQKLDTMLIRGRGIQSFFDRVAGKRMKSVYEKEYGSFDVRFKNCKDAYLIGYWQSEEYFSEIKEKIIRLFHPVLQPSEKCQTMIEEIENCRNSVSVHLRMGDYLQADNQRVYGGICTREYYQKAFEYMQSEMKDPVFYVFSNDLEAAETFFGKYHVKIVDCNDLSEAWADLHLMSLCRNHIVANSSFSWWGAYLNQNIDKMIIAPAKWVNTYKMPDVCPKSWIRI